MKRKFGKRTAEFLYIMKHVERKECPACGFKVPEKHVICPNCGFNPPIAGGFLNEKEIEEVIEGLTSGQWFS